MKVLTFNLWHGLSPSSLIAFESLEPRTRRALRQKMQIETIRRVEPDICFFQEVNPAVERAVEFERHLGLEGCYQLDLVGVKLFGLGVPFNLNSGLYIGVSKRWGLKRLEGISLSRPGLNLARRLASWQLKEERFALFAETLLPKWGRVLLVNTHIHHGLEATADFMAKLEKLILEYGLAADVVSELKERFEQANQRREQQIGVLLDALEDYRSRYEVILMGGDFNAVPESAVAARLREFGFRDAWAEAARSGSVAGQGSSAIDDRVSSAIADQGSSVIDNSGSFAISNDGKSAISNDGDLGFTFDHTRNEANHKLQTRFPLSLVLEDLTFSAKVKEALLSLAREQEFRPRRIDYVWVLETSGAKVSSVSSSAIANSLKIKSAELIGLPDQEGMAPSDHFGVLVDVEV